MTAELRSRLETLAGRVVEARRVLQLDERETEIRLLEEETMKPDFWSNAEEAQKTSKKLGDLRKEVEAWKIFSSQIDDAKTMCDLADESKEDSLISEIESSVSELEKAYATMEFAMLMNGPHDVSNAVVAIHAGAGGTDAQDWAEILLRMYGRFAEQKEWNVRLVDESRGTEAGIKSATFFVEGRYAYGYLKGEAGVHRLVRMSPFNADGLRQTSFALVEVLPEIDDSVEVEIKQDDLRIDTFMSGGKGGQSVNTTYSAVRIVHLPTKITVTCQNERSQTQNRETAMKILKGKLVKMKEDELLKEKQALRGEFHSAEWGNQIRSYVLAPYRMVKDHRTNAETSDTDGVLDGKLDLFIEAELRWMAEGGA